MGPLEKPLRIPANEGCWGRGRGAEGLQIKVLFAACLLGVL